MSVADSGADISISNAERRYANVSPLLLVLKYQQQVLSSLSALLGGLFAIGFAVVGAIWAYRLATGALQGQGLALEWPDRFGVMHWALFAGGWVVALLGVAFVGPGARIPFMLVLLTPIGWLGLAWLGVERLVSRVGKAGGIIGLVLGLLMLLSAVMGLDAGFGAGMRAADDVFQFWPAAGVAIGVLAVPLFLLPWHLIWVVFRAAITMLRLSPRERLLLRDAPPGKGSVTRLITRMWGMPPTLAFVRRPRGRYASIVVLAMLAAFFFAVASVFIIMSNAPLRQFDGIRYACQDRQQSIPYTECLRAAVPRFLVFSSIFIAAVVGLFVAIGAVCQRASRRLTRFSLEALQRVDPRPPVLFLRAFGDDQVPLRPSRVPLLTKLLEFGRRKTSLDQMLLDEVTPYGPLVALGSPGDRRPPYGAARGYFDDLSWQDAVAQLSNDGAAVIICLDDTDGIWWEVEHLVAERHLAKTLFLVHPKHAAAEANMRIVGRLASHLGLDPAEAARLTANPPGTGRRAEPVLGFFLDRDGQLQIVRSASHRHLAYLLTIRLYLRQTLETVALRKA